MFRVDGVTVLFSHGRDTNQSHASLSSCIREIDVFTAEWNKSQFDFNVFETIAFDYQL